MYLYVVACVWSRKYNFFVKAICVSLVVLNYWNFIYHLFFCFFVFFRVSFDYVLRLLLCDSFVICLAFVSKFCVHWFFVLWFVVFDSCRLTFVVWHIQSYLLF